MQPRSQPIVVVIVIVTGVSALAALATDDNPAVTALLVGVPTALVTWAGARVLCRPSPAQRLEPGARAKVKAAVRRGAAVTDHRLAGVAIEQARFVRRRAQNLLFLGVGMTLVTAGAGLVTDGAWTASAWGPAIWFTGIGPFRRARQAEAANRALAA